jgi:hypothetical protein
MLPESPSNLLFYRPIEARDDSLLGVCETVKGVPVCEEFKCLGSCPCLSARRSRSSPGDSAVGRKLPPSAPPRVNGEKVTRFAPPDDVNVICASNSRTTRVPFCLTNPRTRGYDTIHDSWGTRRARDSWGCTRRQRRLIHAFGGRCGAHVPVPCPRTSPVSPLLRPAHCLHTLVGASRLVR